MDGCRITRAVLDGRLEVGPIEFSVEAARELLLAAQGLGSAPQRATKDDVRRIIRRMGVLQIDSISVVARSPYLVLWSRLGSYEPRWLDELLAEGALFEYWSHAACFIPIEDYGLYRRLMMEGRGEDQDLDAGPSRGDRARDGAHK